MIPDERFDHTLAQWFEQDASKVEPAGFDTVIDAAVRRSRQRPAWLATMRHGAAAELPWATGRPRVAAVYLLLVLGLTLALVAAAIVGSTVLRAPGPVGRNGHIAYALADLTSRPWQTVHVVAHDGSADTVIGDGTGQVYSRDGRVLAYWQGPYPDVVLTVSAPDGTGARAVPGIPGDAPIALSPDGTRIAWFRRVGDRTATAPSGTVTAGGGDYELWVSPLDGRAGTRIVPPDPDPSGGRSFSSPVWSPDAGWIAFVGTTDVAYDHGDVYVDGELTDAAGSETRNYGSAIYVVRPDGSDLRRVSTRPGPDVRVLSWSPDSRWIAYAGWRDGTPLPSVPAVAEQPSAFPEWAEVVGRPFSPQDQGIFVVGVDGADEHAVVSDGTLTDGPAVWSGDGRHIAYQALRADGWHLGVVPMDGPVPAGAPAIGPLTSSDFAWSPDAKALLFSWHGPRDPAVGHAIPKAVLETTIQTIPADLLGAPSPLFVAPQEVGGFTWQWLDPHITDIDGGAP